MPDAPTTFTTSYERPVDATLFVRLADGDEWPATADDLRKFGLVRAIDVYNVFRRKLDRILRDGGALPPSQDLTEARLNSLRYLVELAATCPDLLEDGEFAPTAADIVRIEKALQGVSGDAKCGDPGNCTCHHGCDIP